MPGPHSGQGGGRGAAWQHSRVPRLPSPPGSAALGAEPISSGSKAEPGSRGRCSQAPAPSASPAPPGSAAPPVPPTGHRPGPSSAARQRGFSRPPAFVFYLVLLFSPLWSFVPACPLFRRLWFLVPLMLCHSLHLGAFLSPRILKLAVVFSPRSVLGIFILSPASSTPRVTWARPGLSSNPHLSCFGAWISLPLCPFLRDSQRFFFSPHRGK